MTHGAAQQRPGGVPRLRFAVAGLLAILLAGCAGTMGERHAAPDLVHFRPGTWESIDSLLADAVARNEIPGAVVAVARDNRILYLHAAGLRSIAPRRSMRPDTCFDVASLTKPVATSAAVAILERDGRWGADHALAGVGVDDILRHAGGFTPNVPWSELASHLHVGPTPTRSQFLGATIPVLSRARLAGFPTGNACSYSNTAYLLLGLEVQRETACTLEELLQPSLWRPLSMRRTTFHPLGVTGNVAATARPDERGPEKGHPFDPLADFVLRRGCGLQPGHSGLFSNAEDLSRFCQALLHPSDSPVGEMGFISRFLLGEPRLLPVWRPDKDAAETTSRTRAFEADVRNPDILRQTGYTGCMMWLDRRSGTSIVLLTNATLYPGADFKGLVDSLVSNVQRGILPERVDP